MNVPKIAAMAYADPIARVAHGRPTGAHPMSLDADAHRRSPPHAAQAHLLARQRARRSRWWPWSAPPSRWRRAAGCSPCRRLHRPHQDQGLIRGNQDRVEALDRLGAFERARGDRAHRQPRRHHRRLRAALRLAARARRPRSRWWSWSTGWPPPAPISPRCPPTTSWRRTPRWSARSACCSSFPTSPTLLQDRRHPGGGDQVLAAQGGAQRLRADQPGGARRHRGDRAQTPMPGSKVW